jgi:cytochrome c biogenesis protein CcmG/thiol:disulfide interchange protein DsbE
VPLLVASAVFAEVAGGYMALRQPSGPSLRLGSPAPEFSLPVPGAAEVSLVALRGHVVFVNFWATWCAPCREEAPSLERLYKSLSADGFALLGISIDAADAAAAVEAFRSEYGLTFPIPRDPEKPVYGAYQASGVPETFLVDREGRVLERFVGPQNWDDPRYAREIRRALAAGGRADSEGGNGGS